MLRYVTITVAIIATLSLFSSCRAREDKPTDDKASKDKPSNGTISRDRPADGTASKDKPTNGATSKARLATSTTSKAKPTLVTGIARDALLKLMGITPARVEVSQMGWTVMNKKRGKGEKVQLCVAVCASRRKAEAVYRHGLSLRSVGPPAVAPGLPPKFKVGDHCTIYSSDTTFVRDNVVVVVQWRGLNDMRTLVRLDNLLRSESAIVKRGHFTEVPELKIAHESVVIAGSETKKVQIAWSGMGEKQPMWYISSPGRMFNTVEGATVQLRLGTGSPVEQYPYPVRVYAVGEGLAFATATINVTIRPAQTQPSSTQLGGSDIPPATRPNGPPHRDKTP